MAFANTMDRNLAAARAAMTSDRAYRGTGVSRPRRVPTYGGGPGKGGQGNIRRVSRQPGIAEANIRPRGGGIYNTAKAKGREFVHPGLEMMGKFGDLVSGAMRGSRLHQSYQDELGRVKGHEAWKDAKMKMMTQEDQDYYDKYMNLADMAQDNEKAQYYRDQAETAWRNKQTSDRLAAIMGFEDYDKSPDADKYFVEQTDYRGRPIPGLGRLKEVLQQWAPQEEGLIKSPHLDPDMDITADLPSAISYADPDPANDLLYGEPGTESFRPEIKEKPSFPFFPEDYEYPDERQLAPYSPPVDPFGGMYESPLTDRLYGEPTNIGLASEKALGKRGFAIPGGIPGGEEYTGPLPLLSIGFGDDDPITPNITDLDYFNQFTGRNFANPGGMANPTDEEEQINPNWGSTKKAPWWTKAYGG